MMTINWDAEDRFSVLTCSGWLPRSRGDIFGFLRDALQLEQITPARLNFRVLTRGPIKLEKGCLIDDGIRLHGIPIGWQTEISWWEPPCASTARHVCGPFQPWEHLDTFKEVEGRTRTVDGVRYKPCGGSLVNWLVVERDLYRIFVYLERRMLELFPATASAKKVGNL